MTFSMTYHTIADCAGETWLKLQFNTKHCSRGETWLISGRQVPILRFQLASCNTEMEVEHTSTLVDTLVLNVLNVSYCFSEHWRNEYCLLKKRQLPGVALLSAQSLVSLRSSSWKTFPESVSMPLDELSWRISPMTKGSPSPGRINGEKLPKNSERHEA